MKVCLAQNTPLKNPFFEESNFFNSNWEKKNFLALQNNQNPKPLNFFISYEKNVNEAIYKKYATILEKETQYWSGRKIKNKLKYLKRIFEHVHLIYLKKYRTYTTFPQLFENNGYDCLTGTTLYALIFESLGFQYTIYETANHTYLIVKLGQETVLFESTDALSGFISDPEIIEETIQKYASQIAPDFNNIIGMIGQKKTVFAPYKTYSEKISIYQLAGLYYYNQGIVDYNLKNYKASIYTLEKAYTLYQSKRILSLLIVSIQEMLKTENLPYSEIKKYTAKTKFYSSLNPEFFD
ncbi:MAG: hypothetical protein EAZ07_09050 [Cytophagales bacterium]|nr:MAG: hypothetical protein EAZ07_09050 [Cytophagales bacterium]